MKILKDVTSMALSEPAIEKVCAKFAKGDLTKQEAFDLLVTANIKNLERYVEVKENGSIRLIRKARARITKLLELSALKVQDLASTYISPSVDLAAASVEGDNSEAYNYVLENLCEMTDPSKGDIKLQPLFSPSRLKKCMKELKKKDETKFEVSAEDGLLLGGVRFGSLTCDDIEDAVRTGKADKTALSLFLDFVGRDEEGNTKEKLGTLGGFVKKVKEQFDGVEGNEFALNCAETLEATMFDLRDALISEQRAADKLAQHEADMKRTARRLKRAGKTGAEREAVTVETFNGGETEAS